MYDRSVQRVLCGLIVLSGCDVVFGLDRTTPPDAPVSPFEPLIIDPGGDIDEDLLPNGTDLCPLIKSNVLGANEDADGDGVGNLCDPAPTVPGDCLALFDAFATNGTLSPHWRSSGAPIELIDSYLEIPAGPETVVYLDIPMPLTSLTVGGYIPGGTGGRRAIQLLFEHDRVQGVTGRACGVERDDASTASSRVTLVNVAAGIDTELAMSPLDDTAIGAGTTVELGWSDKGAGTGVSFAGRCRAELSAGPTMVDTSIEALPPPGDSFALRTLTVGFNVAAIVGYGQCPP